MSDKESSLLLKCIPGHSLMEFELGDMWLEHPHPKRYNELTDGFVLHVKSSRIIDLQAIKMCVEEKKFEMIQLKDEWLIYKPR